MSIVIIDYYMGNLRSVANALEAVGADARISDDPHDLDNASGIVLPGVGAFGDGMRNLRSRGWVEALERNVLERGTPFLGLCLGMQLLAADGTEHGDHKGLGYVRGSVVRLSSANGAVRVPHIGWNDVVITKNGGLYDGLESRDFYFVHSYVLEPEDQRAVTAVCEHGYPFVASIEKANIFGTQYHPEKSQRAVLAVLRNFALQC